MSYPTCLALGEISVNNFAAPDDLASTLNFYGAYYRISLPDIDDLSLSIRQLELKTRNGDSNSSTKFFQGIKHNN